MNGDYFSDPDYDDFEFREQHPYVYGDEDDDYDDNSHPNSHYAPSRPTTESDMQFHNEYMAWKARNKERIEQLNQHSAPKPRPHANEDEDIGLLIIVICILAFVVFMCICLGTCE